MTPEKRPSKLLATVVIVVGAALVIVLGVTPKFGWDPFREWYNRLYEKFPIAAVLVTIVLVVMSLWLSVDSYRKTGNTEAFFLQLAMYATVFLLVVIIFLLERCAFRYPPY